MKIVGKVLQTQTLLRIIIINIPYKPFSAEIRAARMTHTDYIYSNSNCNGGTFYRSHIL